MQQFQAVNDGIRLAADRDRGTPTVPAVRFSPDIERRAEKSDHYTIAVFIQTYKTLSR
jgi:hypothetical protein